MAANTTAADQCFSIFSVIGSKSYQWLAPRPLGFADSLANLGLVNK